MIDQPPLQINSSYLRELLHHTGLVSESIKCQKENNGKMKFVVQQSLYFIPLLFSFWGGGVPPFSPSFNYNLVSLLQLPNGLGRGNG
jgi:hypothetical protein